VRMEREAGVTGDKKLRQEAKELAKVELGLHRAADCSIVTSDFEVGLLAKKAPKAEVRLLRWIMDVQEREPIRAGRDAIAFLGGYQHGPNVDAVEHFMTDILPTVAQQLPEVRFLICGSSMPPRFDSFAGPNVEVVGYVPDLQSLFQRCVATVAPLRFGAGFKGKVATSLSYGVPCIASRISTEGTGLTEDDGVIVADSAEGYAKGLRGLYRNEKTWQSLSSRGRQAIDRLYSRAAARELWAQMLEHLGRPVHR